MSKFKTDISGSSYARPYVVGGIVGFAVAVAGGAAAYFLVGPQLVQRAVRTTIDDAVAQAIECAVPTGTGEDGSLYPTPFIFEVSNLVVNPAGSRGTRYLLVSVALEVGSAMDVERLLANEVVVRHELLAHLSSLSIEQLSVSGARDALASSIQQIIERVVPGVLVHRVLFPQYILQ